MLQVDRLNDGRNACCLRRVAPPAWLAGIVDSYGFYEERTSGFRTRRELPNADGVFLINLGDPIRVVGGNGQKLDLAQGEGFAAGAHLRPALSGSGGAQSGVHIHTKLLGLRRLLGVPLRELGDRVVPISSLLPPAALTELARLPGTDLAGQIAILDRALGLCLQSAPRVGRPLREAIRLLRDQPGLDILDVARHVGWSRKHLADRVQDGVGVGPRSLRRLLRFQRATTLLLSGPAGGWADAAAAAGYFDQPHMIREFREFAGLTPGAFVAQSLPDGWGVVEG